MGSLHKGHLALLQRARAENDILVSSIFVNPAQFAPHEDFFRYPWRPESDIEHMIAYGVDKVRLFADFFNTEDSPLLLDIYPKPAGDVSKR